MVQVKKKRWVKKFLIDREKKYKEQPSRSTALPEAEDATRFCAFILLMIKQNTELPELTAHMSA